MANVATLLYEDLCGAVGSPTRRCNLTGNVMAPGRNSNDGYIEVEYRQIIESPTIDLAVRSAAPGTKNAQGIDKETAARTSGVIDYDVYSGFMSLEHGIFWQFGARFFAPTCVQPQSLNKCWSPWQIYGFIVFQPDPFCIRDLNNMSSLGVPVGTVDSLKVMVSSYSQGWRFGGTDLGNTRGTYFDNVRVGLVRVAMLRRCRRRSGTSTRTSSRSTRASRLGTMPRSTRRPRTSSRVSTSSIRRPTLVSCRVTRSWPTRRSRAMASRRASAWT